MQKENFDIEEIVKLSKMNLEEGAINAVAIIGAGVMGQGIAQTIAAAGIEVLIIEKNDEALENAKVSLAESIDREIKRWAMTASEKKAIMARISWTIKFEDAKTVILSLRL